MTTAALARKILEYLKIEDLTVPNGLQADHGTYRLGTVVHRIVHFATSAPDAVSSRIGIECKGFHFLSTHSAMALILFNNKE